MVRRAKAPAICLDGEIWMTIGGETLGGRGRIQLLAHIAESGSITQAAKAIGMSYKAAWDAIDTMNTLAGAPLVERAAGGRGGGGTRLTPRGRQLVDNFVLLEREHQRFIAGLTQQAPALADDYLLIRRMGMKTSARNQFLGRVVRIQTGAVNDEVEVDIAAGRKIIATITHDSTLALDLAPGVEVFALIKASAVMLAAGDGALRLSARNQLAGRVMRVQPGAVNTEVVVELEDGVSIVAVVTKDSAESMQLAPGREVHAIFDAASVILGVPA